MNGSGIRLRVNGQTYYHLDGTADWLKTIVKTTITYRDSDAVIVDSVSADRAQRMYYRRTAILDSLHEMRIIGEQIEHILSNEMRIIGKQIENILFPLNYGKTPTETMQDISEDLDELMAVALDMFGPSDVTRFEECNADDTLRALEANISAYNEDCDG